MKKLSSCFKRFEILFVSFKFSIETFDFNFSSLHAENFENHFKSFMESFMKKLFIKKFPLLYKYSCRERTNVDKLFSILELEKFHDNNCYLNLSKQTNC